MPSISDSLRPIMAHYGVSFRIELARIVHGDQPVQYQFRLALLAPGVDRQTVEGEDLFALLDGIPAMLMQLPNAAEIAAGEVQPPSGGLRDFAITNASVPADTLTAHTVNQATTMAGESAAAAQRMAYGMVSAQEAMVSLNGALYRLANEAANGSRYPVGIVAALGGDRIEGAIDPGGDFGYSVDPPSVTHQEQAQALAYWNSRAEPMTE